MYSKINLNYIYDEGEGQYSLTDFGLQAIKEKFTSSNDEVISSRKNRRGGIIPGKKMVSEEVKNLPMQATGQNNLPDYWKLTSKGQRILWLLAYAQKNNIDGLTTSEIDSLGSRLRDSIEAKNINPLTTGLYKKGYLTSHQGKYRILQPGIDFLKSWRPENQGSENS